MDQELKIGSEYVDLHKRVMKQIEAEPDRWDQRTWANDKNQGTVPADRNELRPPLTSDEAEVTSCHTQYCYAGWTLALEGYTLYHGSGIAVHPNGRRVAIPDEAGRLLGLNRDQQAQIFYHGVTTDEDWIAHPEGFKGLVSEVTGIKFD